MKIKEVKGNTFCIDTGMSYIPFYKINEKEIILLDSGLAKREGEAIDKILEENNYKILGIICTHAHIDHIGNNTYFKNKYKCTIAMPINEAHICNSLINLKPYYCGLTISEVNEKFGHMICKTDIKILDEDELIEVCGESFKIVHTPGHSPGHICIITPDNVAYLGDSLISSGVMRGAKLPYSYMLEEDLQSKTKLYDIKCNKYIIAHKGIYDDVTKLIEDNIKFYKDKAKRVYDLIDCPMNIEEILRSVIKYFDINVNNKDKHRLIERMLRSYVEYLSEKGMIKLNLDNGFLKYSKEQLLK